MLCLGRTVAIAVSVHLQLTTFCHALVPLVVQPHNFRIITRIRWFRDVATCTIIILTSTFNSPAAYSLVPRPSTPPVFDRLQYDCIATTTDQKLEVQKARERVYITSAIVGRSRIQPCALYCLLGYIDSTTSSSNYMKSSRCMSCKVVTIGS